MFDIDGSCHDADGVKICDGMRKRVRRMQAPPSRKRRAAGQAYRQGPVRVEMDQKCAMHG